ncbi:putative periplasmic binding protein-like I [Helianthus annuus]|nr:putative periplasmic binding protein-like I [Helianthus annuus]
MDISRNRKSTYLSFLILILLCFQIHSKAQEDPPYIEISVGVILDMGSWVGKTVHSWITMAVSEFYRVNCHYKTRILLHSRDTHGEPRQALSAALDLLEKTKVQAILGSQSSAEAKFLAVLGDQETLPILSLSSIPSSRRHPYFLQITQDETTQVKAIVSMALSFGWKNAILIFENTENGRDMATFMTNSLQEKSITITYMSSISTSTSNEILQKELHKFSNMQTKLFIVHASHSLASHLFQNAKYLGMMDAGYKWIVTSKTMNLLNIMDGEVIKSMQGVVGFKSYIPPSRDLQKLTLKWRKEYHVMEPKDINAYAISAYDGISALAMAVEKTQSVLKLNRKDFETTSLAQWGTTLLNQMLRISFDGLSGHFEFLNATQILEIINVIGKEEVKVGFWTIDAAFSKNIGFCSEVFLAAFAGLDPSVVFQFIPFKPKAGVGTVKYNDLIDLVHAGEFDAAIGDITITANRSLYVDFTLPYTDLGLATLSRNADATSSLWIFMKPLSSDLWIVSACFFILLGFVIWILEHQMNDEFQGPMVQQIGATMWFAFSTLVYAHRQKLKSNLSRFVVTVWLFVVLVLVSSYTAALSSLLTVEQIQLASKGGSVGYQHDYPLHGVIVRNVNFFDTRLKSYHTIEELADALSKGSKKGGVDAVIEEIPYIKEFLAQYPFGYSVVVSEDVTNGFGFVFPKGSPLTLEISTQIARLREDGTLQNLQSKWFGQKPNPQSTPAPKILNFKGLRGLFLISGVSMAAAIFLFTLYYIHEKVHYTYAKLTGGRLASILRFLLPQSTIGVE